MATENKDFKVKHGLTVIEGGNFGGPVTVATPTSPLHAATKQYVDTLSSQFKSSVGAVEPVAANDGDFWFDTNIQRLRYYVNSMWIIMPAFNDVGGFDGGDASTLYWSLTLDGGSAATP